MTATIDAETLAQLQTLSFSGKPLVVCDVDEVVVYFVRHFEDYLIRQGFRLATVSYALTGNIRDIETGQPAEAERVGQLIADFFASEIANQSVVEGAAETLARFADRADIILLTNAPHRHRAARIGSLKARGVPHRLVTNDGPKGPAVRWLADRAPGPLFFLDDSPGNLASVRAHVADAHLVHFVADRRFFDLSRPVDGAHLTTHRWPDVDVYLDRVLSAAAAADPAVSLSPSPSAPALPRLKP